MAAISQTIVSNAFSWINVFYFDSNLTEVCCYGSRWQYVSIGTGNGLVPGRRGAITWTNVDPVHRHVYGTRGNGLMRRNDISRHAWFSRNSIRSWVYIKLLLPNDVLCHRFSYLIVATSAPSHYLYQWLMSIEICGTHFNDIVGDIWCSQSPKCIYNCDLRHASAFLCLGVESTEWDREIKQQHLSIFSSSPAFSNIFSWHQNNHSIQLIEILAMRNIMLD